MSKGVYKDNLITPLTIFQMLLLLKNLKNGY